MIGSFRLISLACCRDSEMVRYKEPSSSTTAYGLPSVSVTNIRGVVRGGLPINWSSSAYTRSWATANGPSCISNAINRPMAASTACGTAPGALVGLHVGGDAAQHAQDERACSHGGVGERDVGRRQPGAAAEVVGERVVHEADHRLDDFRRRVIGAGEFAQLVVVDGQEVFVEVEPGVGVALADDLPVHGVEHADQRSERGLQRCFVADFVGEQAQRRADEGVGLAELLADLVQSVGQSDVAGPGHQQTEGDGLGVAVGELLVGRFGKEELAPVGGQRGEGRAVLGQLFGDFIAQQAAEPARRPWPVPRRTCGGIGSQRRKLSNRATSSAAR